MASTFDRIYAGRPKQGAVLTNTPEQEAAANRAAQAAAAMSPETQAAAPQPLSPQATKNAWNYVGAQMEAAQPRVQSQPTETQQPLSYADLFVRMNPYRQPTQEQLEQERKRYRRNAVFAAISDGLSALSNLYYTTKGAPNAYTGGSTLTGKMYERQKELQKERQANQEKWLNGYLNALQMDKTREAADRNYRIQLATLQRQARQDEETKRVNNANIAYRNAMAEAARQKSESNDALTQSRIDVNKSTINKNNASADKMRSGSGGNTPKPGKYTEVSVDGSIIRIPVSSMTESTLYDKAAKAAGITRKAKESDKDYRGRILQDPVAKKKIRELAQKNGGTIIDEEPSDNKPKGSLIENL